VGLITRIVALKLVFNRWRARSKGSPKTVQLSVGDTEVPGGTTRLGSGAIDLEPRRAPDEGTRAPAGPGPATPLELDKGDWKQTAKRTVKEIKDDRVAFAGAAMAYYFFLAIFPALIALVGILGIASIDASGLIESIRSSLPGGAGTALTKALANADNPSESASLIAAVVGIAVALWSASSGMAALQTGLNVAYDVGRDRKFIAKRAIAIVLLLATLVLGGVPSPIFTFGDGAAFTVLGWILTVVAVMVLFSFYYYLAPNRESPRWQWVSAGGVLGGLLWITLSLGFGWYVSNFNSYGKTYGPLAGVIVLVLWLYLSSIAVLIGGELNAELERQAQRSQGAGA
jgi:membrane protein